MDCIKLSTIIVYKTEQSKMNEYRIKAYAKINLGLDVVRRLENGYHEVKMVMQTVGIYDVLDFSGQPAASSSLRIPGNFPRMRIT